MIDNDTSNIHLFHSESKFDKLNISGGVPDDDTRIQSTIWNQMNERKTFTPSQSGRLI